MNSNTTLRRKVCADIDAALEALSTRQFLRPHERLQDALDALGMADMQLSAEKNVAIGRLTRIQLRQVAKASVRRVEVSV